MEGLRESLETMINNIDVYCDLLITGKQDIAFSYRDSMSENFTALIGAVLKVYDMAGFEAVREDKLYWTDQYQRIKDALSSEDVFFTIDVLKNETAQNFKLFMGMIAG